MATGVSGGTAANGSAAFGSGRILLRTIPGTVDQMTEISVQMNRASSYLRMVPTCFPSRRAPLLRGAALPLPLLHFGEMPLSTMATRGLLRYSGLRSATRRLSYYHKGGTSCEPDEELHPNWRYVLHYSSSCVNASAYTAQVLVTAVDTAVASARHHKGDMGTVSRRSLGSILLHFIGCIGDKESTAINRISPCRCLKPL